MVRGETQMPPCSPHGAAAPGSRCHEPVGANELYLRVVALVIVWVGTRAHAAEWRTSAGLAPPGTGWDRLLAMSAAPTTLVPLDVLDHT